MLIPYAAYDAMVGCNKAAMAALAQTLDVMAFPFSFFGLDKIGQELKAAGRMLEWGSREFHDKPVFNLARIPHRGDVVRVCEQSVQSYLYADLLHFKKEQTKNEPDVLIIAPMSGQHATLLRSTVATLIPDHNVFVTDWHNVRDIPAANGAFTLYDYVDYIHGFLNVIGPNTHVIAISQSTVPAIAAASLLAQANAPHQPLSLTLICGPVDTRVSPTAINAYALAHDMHWFENFCISTVPFHYRGAGQRVYPGHQHLALSMLKNFSGHVRSHHEMLDHYRNDPNGAPSIHEPFYHERRSTMDLSAPYFLQTIRDVFQKHALPRNEMVLGERPITPSAIRRTALLTIEGGQDDITGLGQTFAAHAICKNIPKDGRFHHVEPEASHYGLIDGPLWQGHIYPRVAAFIRKIGARNGLKYSEISGERYPLPSNLVNG